MTTTQDRSLARVNAGPIALRLAGDEARLKVLKEVIAPGCTDAELETFALVCERTKLDPFAKQIYAIKRRVQENGEWVSRLTIVTGVDGFRLNAQRSREYQGQVGPQWCGEDGRWLDVWLREEPPAAARVGVLRKGFREPIWGTAVWTRAAQYTGQGNNKRLTTFWQTRGAEQLAKCAEVNAIKRAFPQDTYGLEFEPEEVQAHSDRYREIFGDEESGSAYDLDRKPVQHNGRTIDADTGEVLDEAPAPAPETFKCAECGATVMDQAGNAINDNQRDLLVQRFGKVLCRTCRTA